MASAAKQASRWGSFLQQAVAGVESRLDNILADGDDTIKAKPGPLAPATTVSMVKSETGQTKLSSVTSSTNDRLQERLARAVAAKSYGLQKTESEASSSNVSSRVASPIRNPDRSRQSLEHTQISTENGEPKPLSSGPEKHSLTVQAGDLDTPIEHTMQILVKDGPLNASDAQSVPMEASFPNITRRSLEGSNHPNESNDSLGLDVSIDVTEGADAPKHAVLDQQLLSDVEIADLQRQEEMHGYIERIDALQAKLQYLSREAVDAARKAAGAAPSGSLEKKLAEKDEQIAGLLEEGQKLSKAELKYMTTIKKLRSMNNEFEKEAAEALKLREKSEKEKSLMLERMKRAEAIERVSIERQRSIAQLQKDMDAVVADRDVKACIIADLKTQLSDSASQAKSEEVRAVQEALVQERRHVVELENDISSLKIEKELAAGKAKVQIDDLVARIERESERARIAEMEMKGEQQILESRLEIMRTRAEEVSSGATGDAQAKLLRQIETLQSQYAIASENWRGIETSLTARNTTLEKERDEALRREADIRRKAREATLKIKRTEDELEHARTQIEDLRQELIVQRKEMEKWRAGTRNAEAALIESSAAFDQERQAMQSEIQQRIEEERTKWREDILGQPSFGYNRADSPVASSRKGLTAEHLGLQNLQTRRGSSRSATNEMPGTDRLASRPSSARRMQSSGNGTPQRKDSTLSFNINGELFETPSIHAMDQDDYFENVPTPGSPQHTPQDLVSVSTVGAGPSVQLVERMSAAVRRLESEKVSTKEELLRLSSQRDEARAQIVLLMQEVEAKRTAYQRMQDLEDEVKTINARYQTTLEMLGEKSELVEELRADVDDVKAMYRELVERTILK